MATTPIAIDGAPSRSAALPVVGATAVALAAVALAATGAADRDEAVVTAAGIVVVSWSLLTIFLAARRPQEMLWLWTGAGALVGAAALTSNRFLGVVPFVALGLALALPTGALVHALRPGCVDDRCRRRRAGHRDHRGDRISVGRVGSR